LKNVAAGTTTLMVVPAFLTSCEDDAPDPDDNKDPDNELVIDLNDAKYSDLGTSGGFVIESSIIIINTGDGYLALSSVCTHNGCTVSYDHDAGNLPCPCHGSKFSTSGSVVNGPADSPLRRYDISQEGEVLTIAL